MMQPLLLNHVMVGQITRLAASLWFRWVLANAAGMALAAASWALSPFWLPTIGVDPLSGDSVSKLLLAVAVLVTIPQCLVLPRRVGAVGWWALATVGGIFLGIGFSVGLVGIIGVLFGAGLIWPGLVWPLFLLPLILSPVITGAGSGALQSLVLRRSIGRSGWWIYASSLGSLLALPATFGATGGMKEPILAILFGAVAGAVYGIVTGIALERLLARR